MEVAEERRRERRERRGGFQLENKTKSCVCVCVCMRERERFGISPERAAGEDISAFVISCLIIMGHDTLVMSLFRIIYRVNPKAFQRTEEPSQG